MNFFWNQDCTIASNLDYIKKVFNSFFKLNFLINKSGFPENLFSFLELKLRKNLINRGIIRKVFQFSSVQGFQFFLELIWNRKGLTRFTEPFRNFRIIDQTLRYLRRNLFELILIKKISHLNNTQCLVWHFEKKYMGRLFHQELNRNNRPA